MILNSNSVLASLEAMLFAAGDPVEPAKLAEVLDIDVENVIKMLGHLEADYDERGSGIRLIRVDGKYQLCTREAYSEEVRGLLEIKKNTPLSQAAFEVLAIVAYNKTVTRSFIEQIRGVDCSGPVSNLIQKGLIEEKERELSEKQAALATVTMKIADIESLVEEVADTAYEKACEVVTDTVRAETQKEDIRAVEDYKKWLAAPERKAPQEKRDFAVKCLCTVQEQIRNAAQKVLLAQLSKLS